MTASKLPRWTSWVGVLAALGALSGGVYGLAGRYFVTRDAYGADKTAHVVQHTEEAEALTLALVETMGQKFDEYRKASHQAEAVRDRKVDVLVCLVSGGRWDALRDACDKPVPGPAPAPSPVP